MTGRQGGGGGQVVGLLLAAGAGRRLRLGTSKALVTDDRGRSWLDRSVAALHDGGVAEVYVVVGAEAATVAAAMPAGCRTVSARDWQEGMGASLRAGLEAVRLDSPTADAVVVMLVDTPGVGADVVRRVVAQKAANALARATYGGVPGHPVLVGREHWSGVLDVAAGDRGAREYLRSPDVDLVECGDIGSGDDIDTPQALEAWRAHHFG